MLDFLKSSRIGKITNTHSEMISDSMILTNIVNSQVARKNLTAVEFERYRKVFDDINQKKDEISTNLLRYQHRAFKIAHKFEREAGVPYAQICVSAIEISNMYNNLKPVFNEAVGEIVSTYSEYIDSIITDYGLEEKAFEVYNSLSTLYLILLTVFGIKTEHRCSLYSKKALYAMVSTSAGILKLFPSHCRSAGL